jgi:hypothetical protein
MKNPAAFVPGGGSP